MKVIRTSFFTVFCFTVFTFNAQAQFLKKLGKTVKQVATATLSDDEETGKDGKSEKGTDSKENTSQRSAASSSNSSAAVFDYAKHNITVIPAGSATYLSGEYFMEGYSSIQPKDGKIEPTVVVGVMTEAERLSELGEGSPADVAYIYKNGAKTAETTVGKLDKNLLWENKKSDWAVIKEVANMGDNNPYVKPGKDGMSLTISLNGKSYGPYKMVGRMIIDKTKTKFYATVLPQVKDLENQTNYLVSNDGKLKPINFGGDLLANINFTNGCMILSPATTYASQMAKEENEAKQEELQKKIADIMMNHPDENDVIFFSGKKLTNVLTSSPWLDLSGNNLFSIKVDASEKFPKGLYLNGKKIADDKPDQGEGWCNADGSNWAYSTQYSKDKRYDNLHLIFKDGTDVPGVIHPHQISLGDKTYMVWFMYDRSKNPQIQMCSKEL